jgi:hypothetical protein
MPRKMRCFARRRQRKDQERALRTDMPRSANPTTASEAASGTAIDQSRPEDDALAKLPTATSLAVTFEMPVHWSELRKLAAAAPGPLLSKDVDVLTVNSTLSCMGMPYWKLTVPV